MFSHRQFVSLLFMTYVSYRMTNKPTRNNVLGKKIRAYFSLKNLISVLMRNAINLRRLYTVHWLWITLTTLKYFNINHGDQKCFFQFKIVINVLVLSDSFKYLCYVSMAIINSISVRRLTLSVRVWRQQTWDSKSKVGIFLIWNYHKCLS